MNHFIISILKQTFFILFFLTSFLKGYSQNSFDINAADPTNMEEQKENNIAVKNIFNDVLRYRSFEYNKNLNHLTSNNIGDTLVLDFFIDKQYKSVIQHVAKNFHGRTNITSKILGTEFAYCFMVISDTTISISAELPFEDEHFFASVKHGNAYISQVKKSELDATAFPCEVAMINDIETNYQKKVRERNGKELEDSVTIDLLFVYTPAAATWALNDNRVTDIFDLIAQAQQRSMLTMDNSESGITYEIVYVHETNYVEDNTIEDLYRITDPFDGYMDEVHMLRDYYYADQIVFIPAVTFTGGVAWLLNDENGFSPDEDYYAVALSRVQQTSWTYTVVHELGHNMGCGHHHEQSTQPGPGLFYFSSGWRGIVNDNRVCSVLTYEAGSYFSDGLSHTRIPYFSSPDIVLDGVMIGDPVLENNRLTIMYTKTPVSNYRVRPEAELYVDLTEIDFLDVMVPTISDPQTINIAGLGLTEDIEYRKLGANPEAFQINQITWNPETGGELEITFSPLVKKVYNAEIIISCPGALSKIVKLKGSGFYSTHSIIATSSENGTILPSGVVSLEYGSDKKFSFTPNANYFIEEVLVDNVSNPDAITDGYYIFQKVAEDHTIHVSFGTTNISENIFSNILIYSYLNCIIIKKTGFQNALYSQYIEIHDMMGRVIYQTLFTDEEVVIPLQATNGIYTVKVTSQDRKILTKKILIFN